MRSLLLQIVAVTAINLKSIPQRFWLSLSTVVAIALVVMVLLSFLAMSNGFRRTLEGSGSNEVAVVLRGGSQAEINSTLTREQVRLLEDAPGIARNATGKPLASPELYLIVDGIKRASNTKANLPLRGIGQEGAAIRRNITLTQGRMFNPGSNEIVVGKGIVSEFAGFELGQTVNFGSSPWTVVGVFDADGSVFEFRDLGRPAGGAEPVQAQQLFSDHAGPAAEPGVACGAQELQRRRSAAQTRR